jgi:hypothetical protein
VFAVSESKPDVTIELQPGTARVAADGREVTLTTEDLVAATNGRLPADHPLDPAMRAVLNVVGS